MRARGISTEWLKGIPDADKQGFEDTVRHDTVVLTRLLEIVDEKLRGLQSREASLQDYDNPSWAYKQAHVNGVKNGLTQIRSLLLHLT